MTRATSPSKKKGSVPERAHALLSASSASRWLVCTPSAVLGEKEPETTSPFAEEGGRAHAEAESILRAVQGAIATDNRVAIAKAVKAALGAKTEYEIGPYIRYVLERFTELEARDQTAVLLVEIKVDFSNYVPEGFGTADALLIQGDTVEVIDLKYGKGVAVQAVDNPQLRLYALGALQLLDRLYEITNVKTTIVQPRLDSLTSEEISVNELKRWGEEIVRPQAELAAKGEGLFVPGRHCKFCKIAGKCRAQSLQARQLVPASVKPEVATLTASEVANYLQQAEQVESFIKALRERALADLLEGQQISGYKLVEGRANRRYKNELAVVEALTKAEYDPAILYKKQLIGITDMEKLLGAKKFKELLGDLVEKPAGSPTLVPDTDKRPALLTEDAFAEGEPKNKK